MPPATEKIRRPASPIARVALCLVVAVVAWSSSGVGLSATAQAGEIHSGPCGCGKKCRGASCCCGPRSRTPLRNDAKPKGENAVNMPGLVDRETDGPCIGAGHCDDPLIPSSRVPGRWSKICQLLPKPFHTLPASARQIAPEGCEPIPTQYLARIDDPPESLTLH